MNSTPSAATSGRLYLQFLGANATVTGSRYLLEAGKVRVLIDCGLFQGYKPLQLRNWAPLPHRSRLDRCGAAHARAPGIQDAEPAQVPKYLERADLR
jgi:predicted metal-dependent RNase